MKREKKTKDREVHILTIGPYTITADSRQYIVKGVKVNGGYLYFSNLIRALESLVEDDERVCVEVQNLYEMLDVIKKVRKEWLERVEQACRDHPALSQTREVKSLEG